MTLGKLYANSMQVTKAETLFLEIANSQPGNVEAKNMLSKIYFNKALHFFQKENFEEALLQLNKVNGYNNSNPMAYNLKAHILMKQKK